LYCISQVLTIFPLYVAFAVIQNLFFSKTYPFLFLFLSLSFFLSVMGFELKASYLLGRHYTAWATSSPGLVLWDRILLCIPAWPQTQNLPPFIPWILKFQVCTITSGSIFPFMASEVELYLGQSSLPQDYEIIYPFYSLCFPFSGGQGGHWDWVFNSGFHTCKAGSLLLKPHL
jgi:hypothetical protein